jgi:Tfp pilus assembly protein PilO
MKSTRSYGSWLVTVPLVGLACGYLYFVFLPGQKEIRRLKAEIHRQRDFIRLSDQCAVAFQTTHRELERTRQRLGLWTQSAPTQATLSELYGRINGLAKAAGANTTRFEPQPDVRYRTISRVPVSVGFVGSFAAVCTYLHHLEMLPQTIWVEDLKIEKYAKHEENAQCEVTLAVFADNPDDSGQVNRSADR